MPLSKYFGGHGAKVMKSMQAEYGAEKAKRVFYATANKQKAKTRRGTSRGSLMKG
jgi:hypothetical protein